MTTVFVPGDNPVDADGDSVIDGDEILSDSDIREMGLDAAPAGIGPSDEARGIEAAADWQKVVG